MLSEFNERMQGQLEQQRGLDFDLRAKDIKHIDDLKKRVKHGLVLNFPQLQGILMWLMATCTYIVDVAVRKEICSDP